jgi:hypothetical protein
MAKRWEALKILRGMVGTLLVNTMVGVVCLLLSPFSALFNLLLVAIGFSQFLYLIPLLFYLNLHERWGLIKGIWIGVGLTLIVNAGYHVWYLRRLGVFPG